MFVTFLPDICGAGMAVGDYLVRADTVSNKDILRKLYALL
jgi:hypothetical protein